MKTSIPSLEGIERQWHLIDAEDAVLGRIASKAAKILMGKHKPTYTPFLDTGDHVIVVNAAKVRATRPTRMVEEAVQGMLPKSKLGKQMYRKLQVYAGPTHPHQAQKPVQLAS
jgi:large subunit ribosomal protein L13